MRWFESWFRILMETYPPPKCTFIQKSRIKWKSPYVGKSVYQILVNWNKDLPSETHQGFPFDTPVEKNISFATTTKFCQSRVDSLWYTGVDFWILFMLWWRTWIGIRAGEQLFRGISLKKCSLFPSVLQVNPCHPFIKDVNGSMDWNPQPLLLLGMMIIFPEELLS